MSEDFGQIVTAAVSGASNNGNRAPDREKAAAELAHLLGLRSVGRTITGVKLYGTGAAARADIHLDDERTIVLEPTGQYASPSRLAAEIALTIGALPKVKKSEHALRALTLIHSLADHDAERDRAADATSAGLEFLQRATILDCDLSDQAERWGAFSQLHDRDPVQAARAAGASIARYALVLRDAPGRMYVRCGWFAAFVRELLGPYGSQQLAQDMASVGWRRQGRGGWIKATAPDRPATLAWTFYTVPPAWAEDRV
jgi:hypothetical protein